MVWMHDYTFIGSSMNTHLLCLFLPWSLGSLAVGFLSFQVLANSPWVLKQKHRQPIQAVAYALDLVKGAWLLIALNSSEFHKAYNWLMVEAQPFGLNHVGREHLFFGVVNGREIEPLIAILCLVGFLLSKRLLPPGSRLPVPAVAIGICLGCIPLLTSIWFLGFLTAWAVIGNRSIAAALSPLLLCLGALYSFDYCVVIPAKDGWLAGSASCRYMPSTLSFGGWVVLSLVLVMGNRSTLLKFLRRELPTYWNRPRPKDWPMSGLE
jgi:hypothetical protein